MPAPGIARGPALRAGDVVRIRDERWLVVRHTRFDTASIIEVRGADSSNRRARTAFVLPFERLDALPSSTRPRVVSPARWRRAAFEALGSAAPTFEALRTPVGADFTLLPFQLEPALAVTSGLGCRLLIADDVGLGKTIQGALVIAEVFARCRERGHALVVCPAALREQWAAELGTRFGLDTAIVDAPALARLAGAPAAAANPWLSASVAVTSIDFVKRPEVLRSLEPLVWDAIVFDEAHQLSGASDRHAAARVIAERGRTVVLLTATPHSGDDEAFARLCGIGDLGGAFDLSAFRRSRLDADLASRRRTCWLRVAPTPAEREMHRALDEYTRMAWAERGAVHAAVRLAAAVLLRRAASSACSLARSIVRRLELLEMPADMAHQPELPFALDEDDEEPLAVLAAPGLGDPSKERRLLEELRDLADRAADHESKVHALARLLRRAAEPAIVFTEYRDTLAHVAAALGAFAPLQLHGGLTAHERARVLAAFTRGDAQLLLATDAASEGLNLHHRCRLVINLELPWTPLRLEQRAGRVDRLGQPRRVHAVHLVARGTGEETILARLHRRAGRAQAVLDAIRADRGDSEDVVAAIFEATSAAEGRVSRATELPGVAAPPSSLRAQARAEAERLAAARRLAGRPAGASLLTRPIAARLRRPSSPSYFVYRLELADAGEQDVWETIVGIAACVATRAASRQDIRHVVETCAGRFDELLAREHHLLASRLASDLERTVALAIRRERAIADGLRAHAARIAAALVQPRLFDRQVERARSAQRVVLDAAIESCRRRLDDLERQRTAAPSRRALLFALLSTR